MCTPSESSRAFRVCVVLQVGSPLRWCVTAAEKSAGATRKRRRAWSGNGAALTRALRGPRISWPRPKTGGSRIDPGEARCVGVEAELILRTLDDG